MRSSDSNPLRALERVALSCFAPFALALAVAGCTHDWSLVTADAANEVVAVTDVATDVPMAVDAACTPCGAACVDLQNDTSNCGTCGQTCIAPENATSTCVAGTCEIACGAGFDRCSDRCVRTDANPSFCGAACVDCTALPHVNTDTVNCTAGGCTLLNGCEDGWGDCDLQSGTGCETDLRTTANCGACGVSCSGATPTCAPDGSSVFRCAP